MTESAIVAEVLIAVSRLPRSLFHRQNSGRLADARGRWVTFGLEGSGDIMGAYCGWPVAIECKTRSGRLRESQKRFRAAWEAAGGIYLVCRSADDALRGLAALDTTAGDSDPKRTAAG